MSDELREPSLLILSALAAQPLHGYAIIQEVERLSADGLRLRPGTLYAALDRLAAEGLIEPAGEEVVDGRLRRSYRVTTAGGRRLADEVGRLRHNASVAARGLRLGGLA